MTAELAQVCAYTVDAAKYLSQRTEKWVAYKHALTFTFNFINHTVKLQGVPYHQV